MQLHEEVHKMNKWIKHEQHIKTKYWMNTAIKAETKLKAFNKLSIHHEIIII